MNIHTHTYIYTHTQHIDAHTCKNMQLFFYINYLDFIIILSVLACFNDFLSIFKLN
jgi:hypothetical protein